MCVCVCACFARKQIPDQIVDLRKLCPRNATYCFCNKIKRAWKCVFFWISMSVHDLESQQKVLTTSTQRVATPCFLLSSWDSSRTDILASESMQLGGRVGWLVSWCGNLPSAGHDHETCPPPPPAAGYLVDIKTCQALPYFTEVTDTPVVWDLHLVVAYRQPEAHMGLWRPSL